MNSMNNEATKKQKEAYELEKSIWINASAGSGKTSVLTRRITKMLLNGVNPSQILCLTFTKTGALEMKTKINKYLSELVELDDNELKNKLKKDIWTENEVINKDNILTARILFAKILDKSDDFKIMTIHSFCEEILKKFPLESQINPNFDILENENEINSIIYDALNKLFDDKYIDNEFALDENYKKNIKKSRDFLYKYKENDDIANLIKKNILNKRFKLIGFTKQKKINEIDFFEINKEIFNNFFGKDKFEIEFYLEERYNKDFNEIENKNYNEIIEELNNKLENDTKKIIKEFKLNDIFSKKEIFKPKIKINISKILLNEKINKNDLSKIFLNTNNETKTSQIFLKNDITDEIDNIFRNWQEYFCNYIDNLSNLENYFLSKSFLQVTYFVLDYYEKEKKNKNYLDFYDLILETNNSLKQNNMMSWVNYKLDQKIDYVLVDESQDTNPEQWEIINAITENFWSRQDYENKITTPTIFVVGDQKQSIFGFQSANPKNYLDQKKIYNEKMSIKNTNFKEVELNTSFRSLPIILELVDKIFDKNKYQDRYNAINLGEKNELIHNPFKKWKYNDIDVKGRVEIWNLITENKKNEEKEENSIDALISNLNNNKIKRDVDKKEQLAIKIAKKISTWFDEEKHKKIYYKDVNEKIKLRDIKYKDIMILIKSRKPDFLNHLIRELNKKGIPNTGLDEINLKENIIILDILSLLKFISFPDDNLSLAEIIKSPFLNKTEDDLIKLCDVWNNNKKINSKVLLWDIFKEFKDLEKETKFLENIIEKKNELNVKKLILYIFSYKINEKTIKYKFKERFGKNFNEIFNNFLSIINDYEKSTSTDNLIDFINYINTSEINLKKELNQDNDEVKIMTIHSAKGLEAPIVFLPDTFHQNSDIDGSKMENMEKFYFIKNMDETKLVPIINGNKIENIDREEFYEYFRLLYVALTRAENELYICGCGNESKNKINEHTWYYLIKSAMENSSFKKKNNELFYGDEEQFGKKEVEKKENISELEKQKKEIQKYIKIEEELDKNKSNDKELKIENPSDKTKDLYTSSIIDTNTQNKIKKGIIVHKILELVLNINEVERENFIENYKILLDNNSNDIKEQVKKIIKNETFKKMFIDNCESYSELNIGKNESNKTIFGNIDRISVHNNDKTIYILDYKTTSNTHINIKDYAIPSNYASQLNKYKNIINSIYTDYKIYTYILWVDLLELTKIEINQKNNEIIGIIKEIISLY